MIARPKRWPGGRVVHAAVLLAPILAHPGDCIAAGLVFEGAEGYVLTLGAGRSATRVPNGFVIGVPDNGQRRDPLEISVEIVAPPLPAGLSRCSIWRAWPRCVRSRETGGGSSGDALTVTVFHPLDGRYVRYRQTRHVDGVEPRFELLDWLAAGDLRVSRAR